MLEPETTRCGVSQQGGRDEKSTRVTNQQLNKHLTCDQTKIFQVVNQENKINGRTPYLLVILTLFLTNSGQQNQRRYVGSSKQQHTQPAIRLSHLINKTKRRNL